MHTQYTLSKDLAEDLAQFFEYHNPAALKENLRRLLVDFLDYELRTGLSFYLKDFFYPFNSLLDVLDKAGKEIQAFTQQPGEQPPAAAQEKVVAFIKACINPEKIFLLHYHVTKDKHEHLDLLVVIPSTATTSFSHYERVISMANMENISIDVSLHRSEVIQQQLTEGHLYNNMACNKEKLIYSNELPAFSYPSKEILQTMATNAEKQFMQAYAKADSFLEGASNYYVENNRQMTAFMLQQAVELTVRGLITALLGNCAKTHRFKELKKPLRRCLPELQYLLSENEEEENRLLRLLEKAYLESRYTNEFSITDNELQQLVGSAEAFYESAKDLFDAKLKVLLG